MISQTNNIAQSLQENRTKKLLNAALDVFFLVLDEVVIHLK